MVFSLLKRSKKKPKKKSRRAKRISAKKKQVTQRVKKAVLEPEVIGKVTHYFPKVRAGVITVSKGEIDIGDTLYIKGHTTNFKQKVASMQINHVPIKKAKKGDEIGLLVKKRMRAGDAVYKV